MSETADDPILYILMRDDLASLNPGKAVAQGAHAANACVAAAQSNEVEGPLAEMLQAWEAQVPDKHFGTTVCLAVPSEQALRDAIAFARGAGLHADTILDPTYPLVDGRAVHLIPLVTCGYVFAPKSRAQALLTRFDLYP